jgi:hypothetical protein
MTCFEMMEVLNRLIVRTEFDKLADNVYEAVKSLIPDISYFDVRQEIRRYIGELSV